MAILTKDQIKDVLEIYNVKTAKDTHDAVKDLMREILQSSLDAELDDILGYKKYDVLHKQTSNSRNGSYSKGVKSSLGELSLVHSKR